MRLGILCIGRMKSGPERELFARYAKRIGTMRNLGLDGLDVRELDESPIRDIAARITSEGDALLSVLTPEATVAALRRTRRGRQQFGFRPISSRASETPGAKSYGL